MEKKSKIFVVEDNANIRKILSFNLKMKNYDVYEASNGKKALDLINREAIRPDAIILDVMMPEMDGYEVCSYIRNTDSLKSIPIIMLTALNMTSDKVKSFELGADIYIAKPFEIEEVLAQLEVLLKNIELRHTETIESLKKNLEEKTNQLENLKEKLDKVAKDIVEKNQNTLEKIDVFDNMGKLTYSIVHEFKNVLTAITSRIYCVDFYTNEKEKKEYMKTIIDICINCSKVIESLLNLPNKKEIEKSDLDLDSLIEEIIFIFKGEFHLNGIKINKELQNNCNIFANKYHIQQALINILINAKQALVKSETKEIFIKTYKDIKFAYISIKDLGCGIEDKYLNQIFDPFFIIPKENVKTSDLDKKESGLGLTLVKEFVKINDGEIFVKSNFKKWTEFIIKFPLKMV